MRADADAAIPTVLRPTAAVVLALCVSGCIPSSFVSVEPLELRAAYREYSDNVIASGNVSLATRQALNLVPERGAGASEVDRTLRALAESPRLSPSVAAFARAEIALQEGERLRAVDPAAARPYYLLAAHESAELLFPRGRAIRIDPFDQRYRLATGFYNLAVGRYFLALMRPEVGYTGDVVEQTGVGPIGVAFEPDDSSLNAYFFQQFEIAWGVGIRGLRNRYTRDGIGVPMIARRAPGHAFPLEAYLPSGGYTAPMTVYLRFDAGDRGGGERAWIGVADTRMTDHVCFGPQRLPVAADFSAPYAQQIVQDRSRAGGRAALFGRQVAGNRFGITINAPWDPQKIPLVMVHGLASSAEAWRELTNDLLGSDELRGRYQIIHYTSPTTEPVLAAAATFRRELRRFLDDVGYDPAVSPKLVVFGHSMGGLLAKTLVVDSGPSIWARVFTVSPEAAVLTPEQRARFEDALILHPWPSVGRVIFLGTPQRGSDSADGLLGWLGKRLIHVPADFVALLRDVARADPEQLQEGIRAWFRGGSVSSVQSLSPTYPPMQGLASLPIVPGVPYHSLIGDLAARGLAGSDGYVTVASAHLDGAQSESILPIAHAEFDRPAPLNEVYRILRLHAQQLGMPEQRDPTLDCRSAPADRTADAQRSSAPLRYTSSFAAR